MERFEGNDLMATLASFVESTAFGALNDFLAEFQSENGYALPSRYEVVITSPGEGNARKVSMRCEAIDMPGRALNTSMDENIYGIAPEIVDGITFAGDISMTFQSSSDLEERVFFESWQEEAWDRGTWNVKYYKDYIKDIDLYVLDQQDTRRYGIRLRECFPKEVGPVSLSYATASDIIKQSVTMQYRYWETLDINNQPPNLMEKVLDTVISGAERTINANIPKVLSRL
jgi:hypothetical protein